VTLNYLERRNVRYFVIFRYSAEWGSVGGGNYVKVVKDRSSCQQQKCKSKNPVLSMYYLWRYSQRFLKTIF